MRNRYDWRQARELAIRNRRPVEGELPAVQFDYQLPGPVTLLELQESINPLAGVQLSSKESRAGTRVIECWNPQAAWAKIFKNLRLSLIGEEPPAR